ncbi:MAG TPA: hypothetical protein VFD70_05890 [Anaerolineae bacterium]|nr:hypothetical protein [Anaerolineae bacterium]
MSLSFSRSTRTLTNDTFRPSLVGSVIALLVLGVWGSWFALARAPVYEVSAEAQVTRDGQVIARFADNAFARIRPGQTAVLIDSASGEPRRAEVMEIANRSQNRMEPNTVRLYVYGTNPMTQPPKQVQVQVAEESPLLALVRFGAAQARQAKPLNQ